MKKLITSLGLGLALIGTSFAYNANFINQTNQEITIKAAGNSISTISPNNTVSVELDPYTAYALSYKGEWSDQGLGTIQKYSDMVYQITPVNSASGISNMHIQVQADGNDGYVNNVNDGSGNNVYGGLCGQDTGGVTCTLASGDTLKQLDMTFTNIN